MNLFRTTAALSSPRRAFLASTALVPATLAVAGCSQLTSLFSTSNVASVESIIAKIQAVMPYVSGIVSVIGLVVPGVTTGVNIVESALTAASNVFATVKSSMTVAAAQPLVGQIATSISTALTAAGQVAATLPANTQTQVNNLLSEAKSILTDITTFASGVPTTAPTAAMMLPMAPVLPVHMFVRPVS